jgi:hypothetical protein
VTEGYAESSEDEAHESPRVEAGGLDPRAEMVFRCNSPRWQSTLPRATRDRRRRSHLERQSDASRAMALRPAHLAARTRSCASGPRRMRPSVLKSGIPVPAP